MMPCEVFVWALKLSELWIDEMEALKNIMKGDLNGLKAKYMKP